MFKKWVTNYKRKSSTKIDRAIDNNNIVNDGCADDSTNTVADDEKNISCSDETLKDGTLKPKVEYSLYAYDAEDSQVIESDFEEMDVSFKLDDLRITPSQFEAPEDGTLGFPDQLVGADKIFGYENFGNTCYCNSILQCLYHIPTLREGILNFPENDTIYSRQSVMKVMNGKTHRIFTENGLERHVTNPESTDVVKTTTANDIRYPRSLSNNTYGDRPSISSASPVARMFKGFHKNNSSSNIETSMLSSKSTAKLSNKEMINLPGVIVGGRGYINNTLASDITLNANDNRTSASSTKNPTDEQTDIKPLSKHKNISSEQRKRWALITGPIVNVDHNIHNRSNYNLYYGLKDIFECIVANYSYTGVVSPSAFINVLKKENILFNTSMHQDAHEFLNFLLNDLSDFVGMQTIKANSSVDKVDAFSNNFIKKVFQGTLSNRTICLTCDNVTKSIEPFLDLPIEVKEHEPTDIQEVFQNFHQKEMLDGMNKFYCSECSELQEAQRIVGLQQLPSTLAIHLKRFKYTEKLNRNVKLFTPVKYPLHLKVCSTFESSVCKDYELVGVVVHVGGGPTYGHYISICRSKNFGWLLFDDETVESVEEDFALKFTADQESSASAYVLFYEERSTNPSASWTTQAESKQNIEKLLRKSPNIVDQENILKDGEHALLNEPNFATLNDESTEDLKNRLSQNNSSFRKNRIFGFKKHKEP